MREELMDLLKREAKALKELLNVLMEQKKRILSNDLYLLEEIIGQIKISDKEVAICEVERIKLLGDENLKEIVQNSKNSELENLYSEIKEVVTSISNQKTTNEILLKQKMYFNSKLLTLIVPSEDCSGVYDCFGRVKS